MLRIFTPSPITKPMNDGTYILLSSIDPSAETIHMGEMTICSVDDTNDLFTLFDSQFVDDDDRNLYKKNEKFTFLYSKNTSKDISETIVAVDALRLFKLSSLGAGLTMIVDGGSHTYCRRCMETFNEESMKFPRFSLNDHERCELSSFFTKFSEQYNNPEWDGFLPELLDFYREAYRIENPQTAFMNLMVAMEMYRKWMDEYIDGSPNTKDAQIIETETRGRNGRPSGTKKIAVFSSRLLSEHDPDMYRDMKRLISQLYYQRNNFIHGGVQIEDICHRMMFNVVRCVLGKISVCDCTKDVLFKAIMENNVSKVVKDSHFCISKNEIDAFIMSFDR